MPDVLHEATRGELEEAMRHVLVSLRRMPEHWVERRAGLHARLDVLLGEWMDAPDA